MYNLNMRKRDTQKKLELMFNFYKDSLEDIMDININDEVLNKNNIL